jgi:hypothetical protein
VVGTVPAFHGRLVAIYVAPRAGAPMTACVSVEARPGTGLAGDRYALGTGTYSVRADGVALTEADTRRNLVTEGVPLAHLVGRTFRVGDVRLRGLRLAEPCAYLEQLTGLAGVRAALVHRGGLRAEVLDGGSVRVGDAIEPVDDDGSPAGVSTS